MSYFEELKSDLAPLSREAETNRDKAKANNHVPCADSSDWIESLADIEDNDPDEADKEVCDHHRCEPAWALCWWSLDRVNLLFVSVALLDLLTQFRLWHGA